MPKSPEDRALNARDKLLRDTFTPAEVLVSGTFIVCATISFWLASPRSYWVLGIFIIAGAFMPVVFKTHEQTHPFFVDLLWRRVWLLSAPLVYVILTYSIGLFQSPFGNIEVDGNTYQSLLNVDTWRPTTAGFKQTWIALLGFCGMYFVTTSAFVVPKSRAFFERTLPWLCLLATLVCAFGLIQKSIGFEKAIFTAGTGQSDFFAFFPYDGHWAAFALLWCYACMAMALLQNRYEDSPGFTKSTGPWYLSGACLLGFSGFFVEAKWPATILLLGFSWACVLFAFNVFRGPNKPYRTSIGLAGVLLAIAAGTGGLARMRSTNPYAADAESLRRTAVDLFQDNPIFGWGMDSFATLAPYYSNDRLLNTLHERACSDVAQALAELGIVGTALVPLICAGLLIRYIFGGKSIQLTNHLMTGSLFLVALAFLDSPFMSHPVFLSFFILFFSALRWADLSRHKVDEVDAKVALVTHERHRQVPFTTNPKPDKFK
ncbi:MAG: O-antigen ligase family protein [Coraliomargarita sp.]